MIPQVIWEVGFADPYVGNVFTIGDSLRGIVGTTPIGSAWTDITDYVRSWRIKVGAGRADTPTLRYEAGTATIVLNDPDRRFDAANLAGPYVAAGESLVQPMVRVRGTAFWGDVSYPLYYGYADDWEPEYIGNNWTYVTLTATDPSKIFAAKDRAEGTLVGSGEDSGARITRILDLDGWPLADRDIGVGETTLQSTNHAGNALGELQLVQDTEMGEFYFTRAGKATFRPRSAVYTRTRSKTVQATFGDDPAGYAVSGELPYADVKPSTGDDSLANSIQVSRAGGTEQSVTDLPSIAKYLEKTHTRNDLLMETDLAALAWGQALLYQWSKRVYRFATIEFNTPELGMESVLWPVLLGALFGDRWRVLRRPKGGGAAIDKDSFVRGVEFESDGMSWRSSFVLQDATRYAYFVIGDPILGRVGLNAIAF